LDELRFKFFRQNLTVWDLPIFRQIKITVSSKPGVGKRNETERNETEKMENFQKRNETERKKITKSRNETKRKATGNETNRIVTIFLNNLRRCFFLIFFLVFLTPVQKRYFCAYLLKIILEDMVLPIILYQMQA
jgi:hypothetical protein